jgi:hypothetical protein
VFQGIQTYRPQKGQWGDQLSAFSTCFKRKGTESGVELFGKSSRLIMLLKKITFRHVELSSRSVHPSSPVLTVINSIGAHISGQGKLRS